MKTIYFDLSILANTSAGSSVYAWEVCHRLMRLSQPLQVVPITSPFRTVGKTGLDRAITAVLRDTLWQNLFAGLEATKKDYFIFPNVTIVPRKFYHLKYAVFVLDLGNWHNRSNLKWRGRISLNSIPKVLKHADLIFAISEYTAQDVSKEFGIPEEKIIVAPCGLSRVYKSFNSCSTSSINGIELPEHYFLHVGTFEPKKNLLFLLKIYERFREITKDLTTSIKLIFTGGEYWNSSEFFQKINQSAYSDDIKVLGRVESESLPFLYKNAKALIFPSTFEGFGIPVIEALSQGTPALIQANTSLSQFKNFGATVFDNFEVDIWVSELQKIVDSKQRVSQENIEAVTNYFDWDKTAKIVAQALELEKCHD